MVLKYHVGECVYIYCMYINFTDDKAKSPKSEIKGIKALQIYTLLI